MSAKGKSSWAISGVTAEPYSQHSNVSELSVQGKALHFAIDD